VVAGVTALSCFMNYKFNYRFTKTSSALVGFVFGFLGDFLVAKAYYSDIGFTFGFFVIITYLFYKINLENENIKSRRINMGIFLFSYVLGIIALAFLSLSQFRFP